MRIVYLPVVFNDSPFSVITYFCFGDVGLSGSVIDTRFISIAGCK